MHAQTNDAAQWWANPRGGQNSSWIANYQNSLRSRQRLLISQIVRGLDGVTSLLEIGSHCGPNIVRLAKDHPSLTQLTGIDINADAIAAGALWMQREGLSERVQMEVGQIPDATATLPDGCVDVVLSCYTLAYVSPADLDATLYEMGRLAKRAVILAEPMTDGAAVSNHQLTGYAEWTHNYRDAIRWIGSWRGCALEQRSVTPPMDRLNAVLIATRSTPSAASTP